MPRRVYLVYFVKTGQKDLVDDSEISMLLITLARSPVFAASEVLLLDDWIQ